MTYDDEAAEAFQDHVPESVCWGCGPANSEGLQLRSYWSGEESIATWVPAATHAAGPPHVLSGGIIATILDCHGVATAGADAHRHTGDAAWFATAQLTVRYLRPTPIGDAVRLRGTVTARTRSTTTVECSLECAGQQRAAATVVAVRVGDAWVDGSTAGAA